VQTGDLPLQFDPDGSGKVKSYSKPKPVGIFNNKPYLLEEAISGDHALVKAYKTDTLGNCQFRLSSHNFNGAMGSIASHYSEPSS
jgi:3-oxoacid CoA-transferase